MSIINDALKKVQIKLDQRNKNTPSSGQKPAKSPEPNNINEAPKAQPGGVFPAQASTPATAPWSSPQTASNAGQTTGPDDQKTNPGLGLVTIGALAIFCAAGIVYALYNVDSPTPKIMENAPAPVKELIKSIPVQEIRETIVEQKIFTPPPPPPAKTKGLVLNGIMTIDGHPVALINNIIYEVGDDVDGSRITTIDLDHVELNNGKQAVILKLSK